MAEGNGKVSKVDVLIIGAGPAGLMTAAWMSRLGVSTRIVDKRSTKIFTGQADGLQCRSLEIFDSFGFADRVVKEANEMVEICMWNPDEKGIIKRSDRIPDTIPGISRFHEVVLHQGRIGRFFLDHMKKHLDISVERGVMPESLEIDEFKAEDTDAYPVTVKLRHLTDEEATPAQQNGSAKSDGLYRSNIAEDDTDELIRKAREHAGSAETVQAKYVVGCDGAHSWTRRQIGSELVGEPTDYIWGVMDIIPITDFPDIRCRCAIHSAESGSLMVIPREDKIVRLYIQLTEIKPDASGRADRSKITPEVIIKAAQKILSPYKLSYKICDWWTAYQIGQRVGETFHKHNRVFLAGDAVHTHSPKAGQGMNVSMQDTFNLGWKIGLCVRNVCPRSILPTYESERREVAKALIDFDHKFSRLFSGRPAKDITDEAGISMDEFKRVFKEAGFFTSGLSVQYKPSILIVNQSEQKNPSLSNGSRTQSYAADLEMGKRFPSAQVVNQASALPVQFQGLLKSDGRFRIILFAGNILDAAQRQRVESLCESLAPLLRRVTPEGLQSNAIIDTLTLHSAPRTEVDIFHFPEMLRPFDETAGWDYEKIYVDDTSYHEGHGKAYEKYGVDPQKGCLVVLRPDQHVAFVGDIEEGEEVEKYFDKVLLDGIAHRERLVKIVG